ncbi:MAG TPA: glycosidase [Armatimonadota bacterium]|jgi:predicted GH43/DUF377 family glycosyl hydrolase
MKLRRYEGNPILSPVADHPWECLVNTNPGAWYDEERGEVLMLYRAAGDDPEHRIHFGLATSKDGIHFERASDQPILSPSVDGFDAGCVEDARIVKVEGWYVITYASRPFPPGQYWKTGPYVPPNFPRWFPWGIRENATSTGLLLTQDFKTYIRAGRLTDPTTDDRDVILFPEKIGGRFAMMHRPMTWVGGSYGTEFPAMWISFGDDLLSWGDSKLLAKAEYPWENQKIGGNTPPLKTDQGWLTLYHAVGEDRHYRLGAMLLDLRNPSRVTHRTRDWILQPEEWYELEGYYAGVVFPCGSVILKDTLHVYYGGADKYVGLATCPMAELMDSLLSCPTGL